MLHLSFYKCWKIIQGFSNSISKFTYTFTDLLIYLLIWKKKHFFNMFNKHIIKWNIWNSISIIYNTEKLKHNDAFGNDDACCHAVGYNSFILVATTNMLSCIVHFHMRGETTIIIHFFSHCVDNEINHKILHITVLNIAATSTFQSWMWLVHLHYKNKSTSTSYLSWSDMTKSDNLITQTINYNYIQTQLCKCKQSRMLKEAETW